MPGGFCFAAFSPFLVWHWALTKRDVLTSGKSPSPLLPSVFPSLAETMEGQGGSSSLQSAAGGAECFQYQSHTSIVIFPVLFVGVQLFIYFSCRKAGKPIWKEYCSHVTSNYLAVVPGTGLLTVSRWRVGETQLQPRRKRERDLNLTQASLALPFFPSLGSHSYYFSQLALPILHRTASPWPVPLSVHFLPLLKCNTWGNNLPLGGKCLLGTDTLSHLQEKRQVIQFVERARVTTKLMILQMVFNIYF